MSKVEHYSQFKAANRPNIIALASQIGAIDGEVHWDLIEEMKSVLGAEAANASTDDEGSQDEAIARAESWITDHCSGGSILRHGTSQALRSRPTKYDASTARCRWLTSGM